MPRPGYRWRLVTFSTKGSWLPGDPRGWRSRGHKRHSSGDYKHPPPAGEHAGLYNYCRKRSGGEIELPAALRGAVGQAILAYLREAGIRVLAVAVSARHAHLLAELPDTMPLMRVIIGHAKWKSSRAIKAQRPVRSGRQAVILSRWKIPVTSAMFMRTCSTNRGWAPGRGRSSWGLCMIRPMGVLNTRGGAALRPGLDDGRRGALPRSAAADPSPGGLG